MPTRAKSLRSTPKAKRKPARVTPARVRRTLRQTVKVAHKKPPTVKPVVAMAKVPTHTPATPFTKAMKFLQTLTDFERLRIVRYNQQNFDLDRMRYLLKKLGNPEQTFRSIHVAGTKGKGSTCAMTAAMLEACGYKVGLYSSPHLVDIRERIQVNGQMISRDDFARMAKLVEPLAARMKPMPTFFDVITAMAFKYFAEQQLDFA